MQQGATAKVQLGGEARTLRLDFNAIATFEQVAGTDFFAWIARMEVRQRFSVSEVRALVYGCMRAAELAADGKATVTLEEVGGMLSLSGFEELSGALTDLIAAAMPDPDADPTPAAEAAEPAEEEPAPSPS